MKLIIDRFEGDYAVCEMENLKCVNLPKEVVFGASEGDVLKIEILKEEKKEREENVKNLMKKVFKD